MEVKRFPLFFHVVAVVLAHKDVSGRFTQSLMPQDEMILVEWKRLELPKHLQLKSVMPLVLFCLMSQMFWFWIIGRASDPRQQRC